MATRSRSNSRERSERRGLRTSATQEDRLIAPVGSIIEGSAPPEDEGFGNADYRGSERRGRIHHRNAHDRSFRYRVTGELGEGTFGNVYRAVPALLFDGSRSEIDGSSSASVAIKAVRAVSRYTTAAHAEAAFLRDLQQEMASRRSSSSSSSFGASPSRSRKPLESHCIELLATFMCGPHFCMVFPCCGPSVYDVLKASSYNPLPDAVIQIIVEDMLKAVNFMHSIHAIHTDLKPENVLFVDPRVTHRSFPNPHVVVIDFGNATYQEQHHTAIVCTRQYRPPEVILDSGWSFPVDLWSVGCIAFEITVGDALFQTHKNHEHLAMMERLLGPVPVWFARSASPDRLERYFTRAFELRYYTEFATPESKARVTDSPSFREVRRRDLRALLKELIVYDPDKRLTSRQALEHEYFSNEFDSDSSAAALYSSQR